MKPNYPLLFQPIFMERIWGGRQLNSLYKKELPQDKNIGESWEISDRTEGVSVVANGPLQGSNLHELMMQDEKAILGEAHSWHGKFPLLVKILDAMDVLSLQVHPPKEKALEMGGEPKTEMWYVTQALPQAEIYAGLKKGITRTDFEQKIKAGTVAECFHRIKVGEGDVMYLPSGRVHALGAGITLFEIQQNSNTTYRVYDWDRTGLDGKPRELHVNESLAAIDFGDFEPGLVPNIFTDENGFSKRVLVDNELFIAEEVCLRHKATISLVTKACWIAGGIKGSVQITSEYGEVEIVPGKWTLIPAACGRVGFVANQDSKILLAQPSVVSPK